uniref:Thyroid hormone receptor associated protein 3a n=1 Tax=Periophthalmus magnuspinnatus TaxID=409849 RepID=A0A3B3ZE74_9GOBI
SRSRSRSRSPSHNRDKKYPRSYQNNRESRGYHRGFRRPYNFRGRGRGRGYFQRGRYQRGGGGYNNNNNNNRHNWKNYKKQPNKHSRGQFHNGPGSSRSSPHGQPRSDRSCSPVSRHSQHSLCSSHSSPKCTPALSAANKNSKNVQEEHYGQNPIRERERNGEAVDLAGVLAIENNCDEKNQGNWIPLTEVSSPKRTNLSSTSGSTPALSTQITTNTMSNGSLFWKNVCSAPITKKTSPDSLNPMLSSFDIFSSEEYLDGDKAALSVAFRFLEEQNKNAKGWQNGTGSAVDMEEPKINGKESPAKIDLGPGNQKEDVSGEMPLNSILKVSSSLNGDGGDDKMIKSHTEPFHNEWIHENELSEIKGNNTALQLSEEGKLQNAACVVNTGLDTAIEDPCVRQNQEKSAIFASAFAKREPFHISEDSSPERGCKSRMMAKTSPTLFPITSQKRSREMLMPTDEDLKVLPRKKEATFNVRLDFPADNLLDLVQSSKKDTEFRSIFQHVQAAQVQRSSSEQFAQHIVTIVHHIKQHFTSSGLTLNERFTMYQRQAAEREMIKPRKSPEIHRLEVSPSAFKKHCQIFEAIKRAEGGTYKSSSSSSSSSSEKKQDDMSPVKSEQGSNRVKLDAKETLCARSYEAFHIQIRGRSWNRGSSRCNSTLSAKNDDWDPEYTPKSKKYYL